MSSNARGPDTPDPGVAPLWQFLTLALWVSCLGVGAGGFWLRYGVPRATMQPPAPVQAVLLTVQVVKDPPRGTDVAPSPPAKSESPPPDEAVAPPAPVVAEPSPAIAFAVPVEGPARMVEARRAVPTAAAAPAIQRLTFGQGEGRQPAPVYPREAVTAGEQGAVGVRFDVAADGRVLSVRVTSPSRWPLLNRAAADVVREQWRFPSGSPRIYDITIRFQLSGL